MWYSIVGRSGLHLHNVPAQRQGIGGSNAVCVRNHLPNDLIGVGIGNLKHSALQDRASGLVKRCVLETVIKEFYTDSEGYINLDSSLLSGGYTMEMLSAPGGYVVDSIPRNVSTMFGR